MKEGNPLNSSVENAQGWKEEFSPEDFSHLIDDMSEVDFSDYLERASAAIEKGGRLSPEVTRILIEKALDISPDQMAFMFIRSLLPGRVDRVEGQDTMYDTVFKVFVDLAASRPEDVHRLFDMLLQDGQMIRPNVLVDGIVEVLSNENVPYYLKTELSDGFNYVYSFYGPSLDEAIQNSLDFDNPENFSKTGQFIEFLSWVYNTDQTWGYSDDRTSTGLYSRLVEAYKGNKGSYLLHLRVGEIISQIEDNQYVHDPDMHMPFLIHERIYAMPYQSKILLTDFKDYEAVTSQLQTVLSKDQETTPADIQRENGQKLFSYFSHVLDLSAPDVIVDRPDKTDEEKKTEAQDMQDFKYIMQRSIREGLEKDFNFRLPELDMREQFYFLKFIKSQGVEEIDRVKQFAHDFGISGLRSFLAVDYGLDTGEKILDLGERLPQEDAYSIIEEFASIAENAMSILRKVDTASGLPEDVPFAFAFEMQEAIMRRTKDLLIAAHEIGIEGIESEYTLGDVEYSLVGINLLLEVLDNLDGEGNFHITKTLQTESHVSYELEDKMADLDYKLRIFVRPRAESKAQARVNIELDFDTERPNIDMKRAFSSTTKYRDKKKVIEESVLRLGIDLDTYGPSSKLSLDIGRNKREGDTYTRSGDVVGNLLQLVSDTGHHTPQSFSPEFSDPDEFAQVAGLLKDYFDQTPLSV